MFYTIFDYLQQTDTFDFPGRHLMTYISFRAGVAFALSLVSGLVFGRRVSVLNPPGPDPSLGVGSGPLPRVLK